MKHFTQNLRWLFMSLLLVVGGNAWAGEETVTFSEKNYDNGEAVEECKGSNFTINFNKGTNSNSPKYYISGSAIRTYGGNTFTISSTNTITSIVFTFASGGGSNAITADLGTYEDGTWTGAATSVTFTIGGTSGHRRISSVTVTYSDGGDTPAKTTTTTTFNADANSYTVKEGDAFTAPTATVSVENATVTYSSTNEDVATVDEITGAVTIIAAGETTIKATYAGDNTYYGSSASYTLKVVSADLPSYTSLQELQDNATSTSTEIRLTLTNVYVTGVKGSNAYLSDGTYGALVYTSNHGLEAGKKLNGTITAKSVLYRGQTEITDFSTEGLTITEEALAAKEVTDLSTITAANQSLLVTLKNVTYDGTNFVDAAGTKIQFYDNFSTGVTLTTDATYDITGIVILYNTTLEIAPRTADDIVALSDEPDNPDNPDEPDGTFTWDATNYNSDTELSTVTQDTDPISIVFAMGTSTNVTKYYSNGDATRFYKGNTVTFTATKGYAISNIQITFKSASYAKTLSPTTGTYTKNEASGTWSGFANSVTLTNNDAAARFTSITIYYSEATEVPATITSAGYATFCPTFNVSLPEGVTAYTVSAISNGYATLAEVSTIKAGTPVILQGEAGEYALPIIEDAEAVITNFLKVSDGTVKGAANIYALANKDGVGFYPVSSDVTIPAGKCYLETSAGEAAKERIDFDFSGATAIEAIATENASADDVIYNLNGQRVTTPTKGIFIKNGKKVFVR